VAVSFIDGEKWNLFKKFNDHLLMTSFFFKAIIFVTISPNIVSSFIQVEVAAPLKIY
jgi:hypothetical protein